MKRLFLCVMAAGALLAAPSCIKNDEPAGIEQMRKGKAELLKAEALVQQAEAKIREAEAEVQKAYAAQEAAVARMREAEAQLKELEVEMQQARNEEERARIAQNMARIESETALAAETARQALLAAQAQTARAEAEYEQSMAQLQVWVMENGAESVYARQLTKVIGKMGEIRLEIAGIQKQIADATTGLYDTTVDEKAWVREQERSIAMQEQSIALYNDAIAYWSALSKANEVKWGEELEALKAKREAAYPVYVDLKKAYDEAEAAHTQMQQEISDKRTAFYTEHDRKAEATRQEFAEKLEAVRKPATGQFVLTIPASEEFRLAYGHIFVNSGWMQDDEAEAFVYNESENSVYAADIARMLLSDDDNGEAQAGMIYELRRSLFTPTDLANAEQKLASLKQDAERAEAAHEEDAEAFDKALKAFRGAAAAYKFDWTRTRQQTLQDDIRAQWAEFLAIGAPTEAQKKAIATAVAGYIEVRDSFEEGFDEQIVAGETKTLLSALIVKNFEEYVMGANRPIVEEKINAYMDYTDPATVTAKLAAAADKAYGIGALLLHRIEAEDCYKGSNRLLNPIKEVYMVGGGSWGYMFDCVDGSFGGLIEAGRIAAAFEARIGCQEELEGVIAAAEKYFEQYDAIAEGVEQAVEKLLGEQKDAEKALEAEVKAFDESMKADEKKLQQAGYAAIDARAAMEAAHEEYMLYEADIRRVEGYIGMGAGNDENGEWIEFVAGDIEEYVEQLTDTVAEKNDRLEKTKNLLKTYEETGFTDEILSEQLAHIQARIDNLREQLADARSRFDALAAQKDELVALMKNE